MPRPLAVAVLAVLSALPVSLLAHQPAQTATAPTRDPQALAVLTRALAAAGVSTQAGSIQDFTGTGSITYFWAGQEVVGQVTLRGRGTSQFRLDANLAEGMRSWTVSDGQGAVREPSGKKSTIPFSNACNLGSLTLPYVQLLAAINDTSESVLLLSPLTVGGQQVYDIRLRQNFARQDNPTGDLSKASVKDYLISQTTYTIVATQDTQYSNDAPWHSFKHELVFSDNRTVNGLLLPYAITETIEGQKTWAIQLSSISLNTGLTDSTFQF
jgi:hypothetical protein